MSTDPRWDELINGKRSRVGCLRKDSLAQLKPGGKLTINKFNSQYGILRHYHFPVLSRREYASIRGMVSVEGPSIAPNCEKKAEAIKFYQTVITPEEEKKYGLVVFSIEKPEAPISEQLTLETLIKVREDHITRIKHFQKHITEVEGYIRNLDVIISPPILEGKEGVVKKEEGVSLPLPEK